VNRNLIIIGFLFFFEVKLFAQNDSLIHPIMNADTLIQSPGFIVDTSYTEVGIASYYAKRFEGRKCANGEIFRHAQLTAAHKTLKLGTYVRVTNLRNDSVVIVKVNDRLPKKSKRSIDLTMKAAKQLNFVQRGLTKVKIERVILIENKE
jgi:rare lipoprotein A (peptidoglycan hydrolase)